MAQKRICLLGGYSFENYGDQITYYCLYEVCQSLGYSVSMCPWPYRYKRIFDRYAYPIKTWQPRKHPFIFKSNPYTDGSLLEPVKERIQLKELNEKFDIFMVGSGQYFHPRVLNNIRYYTLLDWVDKGKKILAYSAAWGDGKYPTDDPLELRLIKECLSRFDGISVREDKSVIVSKETFGIRTHWVIDPVFLCERQTLENLVHKSQVQVQIRNRNDKFVFS